MKDRPTVITFKPNLDEHSISQFSNAFQRFATVIQLKAGETLAETGTLPRSCYWIQHGIVVGKIPVVNDKKGTLGLTTFHRSGTLLFYENNLIKQPLSTSYSALTDCTLFAMDVNDLDQAVAEHPETQKTFLYILSQNALTAMKQANGTFRADLGWHYCNLLIMLAEECGKNTSEGIIIYSPINQTDMAKLLNVSRTSLHFICQKLQEQGIIIQKKMEIIIPSLKALIQFRDNLK